MQVDDRGGKEKGFVDAPPPAQEEQADRGMTLNPDTIQSDFDHVVTSELAPSLEVNLDRGALNPETTPSDVDHIVTGGLLPGLQASLDGGTLNSDLDHIATEGLLPGLEPNLDRGKSLQASWQAKVAPRTIVPETDDTPATALPRRSDLSDGRAKLRSANPELDDDDDKWKCVPYFGAVLLFFSWILQNWTRRVTKGKVDSFKFEPNALLSVGSVNGEERYKPYGVRPSALDMFGAAFSVASEPQQEVAEGKEETMIEHFSGDPDVKEARAQIEHAQEIKQSLDRGFDGIGLG